MDYAFEHDLRAGRHLQLAAQAFHQFGLGAAQQARELIFGERIGHRRDRAEHGGRVRAQSHCQRKRLSLMLQAMVAEIECAAALRQPAHDDLVRRDHLLAIDAQVLPRLLRPARDREAPGDQRAGVARPAGLDRQPGKIDVLALPHDFLAGRASRYLRRHVDHLLQHRQLVPGVLQTLGRIRLLQIARAACPLRAAPRPIPRPCPARRAAACRTDSPAPGCARALIPSTLGLFEQDGRPAGLEHAVAHLGHLQARIDLHRDALQLALLFQLRDEVAQILVAHG